MALLAAVTTGDMANRFARCLDAIMAGLTGVINQPVIKTIYLPFACNVALIALVTAGEMGGRFPLCFHTIMTA